MVSNARDGGRDLGSLTNVATASVFSPRREGALHIGMVLE
jgi:hypothetical protein